MFIRSERLETGASGTSVKLALNRPLTESIRPSRTISAWGFPRAKTTSGSLCSEDLRKTGPWRGSCRIGVVALA